ncbi:hypothetical protein GCM10027290_38930 [Micromonospora sonneratiae]
MVVECGSLGLAESSADTVFSPVRKKDAGQVGTPCGSGGDRRTPTWIILPCPDYRTHSVPAIADIPRCRQPDPPRSARQFDGGPPEPGTSTPLTEVELGDGDNQGRRPVIIDGWQTGHR